MRLLTPYLFEVIEHSSIFLCEECHSYSCLPCPTCATNTMCVVLNVLSHVIVDHIGHVPVGGEHTGDGTSLIPLWLVCSTFRGTWCSPDINASTCHVCGHQDVLSPLLQASQSILPAKQLAKCYTWQWEYCLLHTVGPHFVGYVIFIYQFFVHYGFQCMREM